MDTADRMATICIKKMTPQMRDSSGNSGGFCFLAMAAAICRNQSMASLPVSRRRRRRHQRMQMYLSVYVMAILDVKELRSTSPRS